MSTTTLYRMAGLALLAGAALNVVGTTLSSILFPGSTLPTPSTSFLYVTLNLLTLVGTILLVLGMPGLTAAQRAQAGRLGVLGIVFIVSAGILFAGTSVLSIVIVPWLAEAAPKLLADNNTPASLNVLFQAASLILGIGGVMLGIATIRAHVFIKWVGWLIIIGTLLNVVTFIPINDTLNAIMSSVANDIFFVGFGWMGYLLYTGVWQAAAAAPAVGAAR